MADLTISCPHCNQHITCDEAWGGHELECPICKGRLVVPGAAPAPAPATTKGGGSPPPAHLGSSKHVVHPPAGGGRLALGSTQSEAGAGQ